jgi:hypothetical protein
MPNTGEAREIKQRVNANEAEVVRESKNLVEKAKADLNRPKREQGVG